MAELQIPDGPPQKIQRCIGIRFEHNQPLLKYENVNESIIEESMYNHFANPVLSKWMNNQLNVPSLTEFAKVNNQLMQHANTQYTLKIKIAWKNQTISKIIENVTIQSNICEMNVAELFEHIKSSLKWCMVEEFKTIADVCLHSYILCYNIMRIIV